MQSDPGRVGTCAVGLIVIGLCALGPATDAGAQLTNYALFFKADFIQTSAVAPLVSDGWFFSDRTGQPTPGEYTTGLLHYPGPDTPARLNPVSPTQLQFVSALFPSKSVLDGTFPFGIYSTTVSNVVTHASQTVGTTYSQDPYPADIPAVLPISYNRLQGMDSTQPFTFQLNSFQTGTIANKSYVFLTIRNPVGGQVAYSASFLPAATTSITVPAGLLQVNTGYNVEIDFSNRISTLVGPLETDQGFDYATFLTFHTESLPGDANLDGTVNFNDLLDLAQNYGGANATWTQGDFNRDGVVNFSDLLILAQHYGGSLNGTPPAVGEAPSQVPEPLSIFSLAVLGALVLTHRRRGRCGIAGWVGLVLLVACGAGPAGANNIVVSGFNEDVVTENTATHFGHRFDLYTPNPADWIENGLSDGIYTAVGLPSSRTFTSATGSGVVYHLAPYNADNVLRMGDNDPLTGTMTVTPGQYSTLHILAAASVAGGTPSPTSDITLNFTSGPVTLTRALVAYDWSMSQSNAPAASIALGGLDRNFIGANQTASSAVTIDPFRHRDFAMYETPLNLGRLGLSGRVLQSITFNDVSPLSSTGVFAIDGTATTRIPGDANLDGTVNFADLLTLAQHYGFFPTATWADGDFNGDGGVNFGDLLILSQNYGQTLLPAAPAGARTSLASTPEPRAAAILTLASLLLGRRRPGHELQT